MDKDIQRIMERLDAIENAAALEHCDTYELLHMIAVKLAKVRLDINDLKRRQDQTVCYLKQKAEEEKETP